MKEGLLERIRSVGHWRINVRPMSEPSDRLSANSAFSLVERNRVSLRGWDYPHVLDRNDECNGRENYQNYVENWCDWRDHLEFWRLYYSTQFLHYKALWEDLRKESNQPQGRLLSVTSTIYTITEVTEFTRRLTNAGLYHDGLQLAINLRNSSNRKLWISEFNRMGFSYDRITHQDDIEITTELAANFDAKSVATDILMKLFSVFGWDPSSAQIEKDVSAYLEGRYR